ncbi:hypothetical protein E6O75_ATG04449 [Venturia nashicola]|uniref:Uncharacterized protein n=1 Tax=Venturia nashicola TaxID=86259 RepID=A0A4Z1PRG9_9PEZI|nr:hypothetical protein E6O75_ATG04449 [Venturia nashicola]
MATNQPAGAHGAGAGHGASTAGNDAGNIIKESAAKIHGLGEAIRGNINTFADSAVGTDSTKSRNVTERGMEEINTGKYQGTGAGVTPVDTKAERVNRDLQGEGGHVGTGQSAYTTTGATAGNTTSDRVV